MAQEAPGSIDVQDVQFKLYDKHTIFNVGTEWRSHISLLAAASSQGLLFIGNPNAPELKVIITKELVDCKAAEKNLLARVVPLHSAPHVIACSADGSMLAVNYTLNNSAFLHICSVVSFTTPDIKTLYQIRLSPEDNVKALQLLWNPVLTATIAVVLSNGALAMFTLKENGQFEMHSLDKSQQVKCGCWSPMGKQIVLGFANGKLQQHKPDLALAKTIACPAGVHASPFDTIAVHWLSTYQFAVVFLQHGNEMSPTLYIVNAPKGVTPTYINYYDICYSATGPRAHQVLFTHIQQWNLLLVLSANGVEVGILGTKETGQTPTWVQYTMIDEARIEMPLTDSKDETYPIGFALDTSSTHQIMIGEKQLPIMPMVHVLSTHGHLLSFNFLNLMPGAVDICSPPPPISESSGQFRPLEETVNAVPTSRPQEQPPTAAQQTQQNAGDTSFAFTPNGVTSTPAVKEKAAPMFGGFSGVAVSASTAASTAPPSGNTFGVQAGNTFTQAAIPSFGATAAKPSAAASVTFSLPTASSANTSLFNTSTAPTFAGFGVGNANASTAPTFAGFGVKPAESFATAATTTTMQQQQPQQPQQLQQLQQQTTITSKSTELNKPLYTVPPTYAAPTTGNIIASQQQQQQQQQQKTSAVQPVLHTKPVTFSANENKEIMKLIAVEINSFDAELEQLARQSKGLLATITNPEEMKTCSRRLNDLQEITEQANDRDFELDVQNLLHSMNESYAMLAECRKKLDMFKNPAMPRLSNISTYDPVNRRQLAKLQSFLAANQVQMQQLEQQIDAQWVNYQDIVRRNTKSQMHIPCLDGIYQRMTKLKDTVSRQRNKLNYIKTKLKQSGFPLKPNNNATEIQLQTSTQANKSLTAMESLADSILSLSLSHFVDASRSKLTDDKLQALRNFTRRQQQITIIKPQRPNRVGINSEFILETKRQSERKAREGATTNLTKMQQEKLPQQAPVVKHAPLAKPTATKPVLAAAVQAQTTFAPPTQAPQTVQPSFSFGGASPFVKTSAASKADELPKASFASTATIAPAPTSTFGTTTFTGFGGVGQKQPLSFAQPKAATTKPELSVRESPSAPTAAVAAMQTPISFAAKVVGGEALKQQQQSTTTTAASGFAALNANNSNIDKENKKPEPQANTKSFNFGGIGAGLSESSNAGSTATAFSGFGSVTKPGNTIFDGKTPFSGAGNSSGSFSFGSLGSSLGTSPFTQYASEATTATSAATFSFGTAAAATKTTAAVATSDAVSSSISTAAIKPTVAPTDGFPKTAGEATNSTAVSAANTGFSFVGASKPAVVSQSNGSVIATATTKPTSTTTSTLSTALDAATVNTTTTNIDTDNLFGGLNICKPTAKVEAESTANIVSNASTPFGFNAIASTESEAASKSIFASAANAGSTFSFGNVTSTFGKTATAAATPATSGNATATTAATTAANVATPFSFLNAATTVTPTSAPAAPQFAGFATLTPTTAATSATTGTATTNSSLFGGTASFLTTSSTASTTSIFGTNGSPVSSTTTTAAGATTPASIFAAATTTAPTSIFAAAAATTTATAAPTNTTPFGTTNNVNGGNLFGGIPKPEQSVFSSPTATTTTAAAKPSPTAPVTGLFAAAAATANPSPFSSPPANVASGGSIFGGATKPSGFGAGNSIFGGSATTTSPFGAAVKPAEGNTNLFGAAAQNAAAGGSIFGQSTFGQAAAVAPQANGNLFATAAAASQPTTGFGASGGGSIFGGTTAFGANATAGSFSAFSQPPAQASAFGSPGSFAQGGSSVAQSGFGSPPQQTSAFAKPVFGGTPAFGTQPQFGGAPTFGSPKQGFGTFAAPASTSPGAFTSPTQKNNLFEALGSTDTGLSFGNLAQTTNNAAPKPTFGGSSFMNYRA